MNQPMTWNLLVEELIEALRQAQPKAIVGLKLTPEQETRIAEASKEEPPGGITSGMYNVRPLDPVQTGPVFWLTIYEPTPDELKSVRPDP